MHSYDLYALLALCTALVGVYAYWHARRYWEGLPPLLDAFVSMAGFVALIGAFVVAGRVGGAYEHPHAARVIAVTFTVIAVRSIRTWIGKEQARYRAARARKPTGESD